MSVAALLLSRVYSADRSIRVAGTVRSLLCGRIRQFQIEGDSLLTVRITALIRGSIIVILDVCSAAATELLLVARLLLTLILATLPLLAVIRGELQRVV